MIDPLVFVYIIPAIFFGAYASLFFKKGAKKFTFNLNKIKDNLTVFFGIILYGFSMILYLFALRHGELSIIYPLTSFSYIIVALLSVKKLKEKMNNYKWAGIFIIIIGSILVVM